MHVDKSIPLDEGGLTWTDLDGSISITSTKAKVVSWHIFYNNSSFDGNDPGASELDRNAIATDKVALLPGNTATAQSGTSNGTQML